MMMINYKINVEINKTDVELKKFKFNKFIKNKNDLSTSAESVALYARSTRACRKKGRISVGRPISAAGVTDGMARSMHREGISRVSHPVEFA